MLRPSAEKLNQFPKLSGFNKLGRWTTFKIIILITNIMPLSCSENLAIVSYLKPAQYSSHHHNLSGCLISHKWIIPENWLERVTLLTYTEEVEVRISAEKPATLTGVSHGFLQSRQANAQIVRIIRPQPYASTSFPIHLHLIIRSFDAM
jgi:hypothetical protein